jgi:enoyl-CoA hydratase/carnithine racemase
LRAVAVGVDTEGHVAVITLDRPERRNAFDLAALDAFEAALVRLRDDQDLWVGIVTGAGGTFSSGADLRSLPQELPERGPDAVLEIARLFSRVGLTKPLVAAIEGAALGGGCEVALACDLRVAAEGASIGMPEARRGLLGGWGGTQRLPRLVGPARAKELLFTGRPVDAAEAHRIGLVNRLAPEGGALAAARALAAEICASAPSSVRLSKRAVDEGLELPLDDALRLEHELFQEALSSPNAAEGMLSFVERREPEWQG